MKDFLLNENFSMLEVPSSSLIPLETKGVFVMRTLQLSFNQEGKTFEIGYLNYEKDTKNVRNSLVHTYYLSLDTRLTSLIEFLRSRYPEQKGVVNNIVQVTLKVTITCEKGTYYTLILKGDKPNGIPLSFKPSEFKDLGNETDSNFTQSLEPLIDSIINEPEEEIMNKNLVIYLPNSNISIGCGFNLVYTEYDYFQDSKRHLYKLVLNEELTSLLDYLRVNNYSSKGNKVEEVWDAYLRISEKKQLASLMVFSDDTDQISEYELIEFVPLSVKDEDKSHVLPKFINVIQSSEVQPTSYIEDKLLQVCKELEEIRDQNSRKLQELRELLKLKDIQPASEAAVKEVVQKVYKRLLSSKKYVQVGCLNSNNKVVFSIPSKSEKDARKKYGWRTYEPGFYVQEIITYTDGITRYGLAQLVVPSNKIIEVEGSARNNSTIGYVENLGGVVEVIYYDRY